ncbi:MAG: hypothetical protein IPG97_16740 [Microthrixaceae bacterium]|nr:hypothetical protein [Microthrixaceae bacterium]
MTDVTWNPAGDDDTSFGPLTAHNVLGGRTAADAHPAAAVSYDNDVSGLTGDTVQEAIDELATSGGAVASVNGETGVVVLDAGDVGAVPTARTITAGTGLTGGGDLSADRTLTVTYGTTAGTAAAGDDARLSDARTPTAHEASHHHDGSDPLDAGDVGAVPVESVGLLPGETNRGTWDVAATYAVGDVVFETGSDLYVATAPSTGAQPSLTPGSWDVLDPTGRHVRLGPGSSATGDGSTAIGTISSATGDASTAIGTISSATSIGSTAIGLMTSATGVGSTAIGYGSSATGDGSTAIGLMTSATGDGDINIGDVFRGRVDDPLGARTPDAASITTGFVDLPETAAVTNPAADHQRLVARTDGLYVRDETGAEVGPLGAGGAVEPGMVPPVSPSAYDQEYWDMADGSPVVGTWHNQGTSTAAISDGRLLMTCQAAASGYNQRALLTTLPSFTSVSTRITVGGELTNHSNAGLVLYNSGTGRLLQWLVHIHGPGKDLELHRANSFTSFDSATTTTGVSVGVGHVYLKITNDGVNLRRWVSDDGDLWIMVGSVTLASWIGSVTGAGVVVGQEHAGIAVTASFDFLRFT